VAVVTGHSRGLGAAIAEQLLARGVRVLGIARQGNADLARRFGAALREVRLDLGDSAALATWLAGDALRQFLSGSATALLVNNAGVLQPIGPLDAQNLSDVSRAVAVNVGAALLLSAAFVQMSADGGERRILHISSGAGRKSYSGWSVYCATKAALDHHARTVAIDGTARLRICSLAPGIIETAMQAEIRGSTDALFPDRERFVKLKREGQLKSPDVAANELVDFLLSKGFGKEPVTELPR
jgi:benzil reductase ((S)-benzoin forming)